MAFAKKFGFSMSIGTDGVPPWSICAVFRLLIDFLMILSSIANFGVDLYFFTEQHR
jgi:hypothetical protein